MKACVTRQCLATVGEWSVPDLEAALATYSEDISTRVDVLIGEALLTIFGGDPQGLSVDLRYEGHRLNARVDIAELSALLNAPDIDAWLRRMDAHDEAWNIQNDIDYQHARDLCR